MEWKSDLANIFTRESNAELLLVPLLNLITFNSEFVIANAIRKICEIA